MITVNLNHLLAERGMNQSELARLTGIRPSTVCEIYNNNCTFLKLENIDKICTALKCGVSDLLTFSEGGGK